MLAERLGMKMHAEHVVSRADREAGVITATVKRANRKKR
jgi:hypothetical protein